MGFRTPSFIKLPRNKRFNFKPRYYDAQKEELENRIAIIKAEMKEEESAKLRSDYDSELTRYKMAQQWKMGSTRKTQFNRSNMRVAFIAAILFLFFYYYLYV
ncbi:MAG: hypothetical protein CL840_20255 [Crocinitomicaceae bacterium]|mgnify:CR=1 FL=1|nr:hypothetical protein [Crocinitomicaceae bacterium]|tara:strand:- start:4823 stop:5128 length:306 start_codon:yes stop_codon:yes gene_type:complete